MTHSISNQEAESEKTAFPNSNDGGDFIVDIDIDSRATTAKHSMTERCKSLPPVTEKETKAAALKAANEEINNLETMPLENYPRGYPLLAAFQSSDSCFSIYRGFDYLHSRAILDLQDELRCLEDTLADLDKMDDKNGRSKCLTSRASDLKQARRKGKPCQRSKILGQIREKLIIYDELLLKRSQLNALQKPSTRDYTSLRRWFFNEKPLSYVLEEQYVKMKEDLVSLREGREWASFDGWIEERVKQLPRCLTRRIFTTPELREKTSNKHIYYCSASRVERLVGLIITIIIFVLLVLPVVAMYKLTSMGKHDTTFNTVGILVVFTLLFSTAMSLLTKAKRHELFAASAAYCAVLVVFISNFNK